MLLQGFLEHLRSAKCPHLGDTIGRLWPLTDVRIRLKAAIHTIRASATPQPGITGLREFPVYPLAVVDFLRGGAESKFARGRPKKINIPLLLVSPSDTPVFPLHVRQSANCQLLVWQRNADCVLC